MKKQSSRARAQSTPPVRHQFDHELPTVIHNPEEDMTALGRWAHHAMLEPGRYLGWPLAVLGLVVLLGIVLRFATAGSSSEAAIWRKLETAKTPAERVDIARADPKSPAATWAMLQAATEFFSQALADLPANRDVALPASKKALDLFDDVSRQAPHDSPQARVAALGKARTLEMRNELSRAMEQYQLVAKEWPGTPEAEEASRYAEALKDPRAAEFYKELYAYTPPKVDLPPLGSATLSPPGTGPAPGGATTPADASSPLSPNLRAIPEPREIIEPRAADKAKAQPAPAKPAMPDPRTQQPAPAKPATPDAKAQPAPAKPATPDARLPAAKPAEPPKQAELPAEVFTPRAGESHPR